MKVAELRDKLSKLKKDEIVKIAAEFYKLIPKAKKEDYGVDALVENPNTQKKNPRTEKHQGLATIEVELRQFIAYAREQYYLAPNRFVPKKERSTWRFKVKKWYKELTHMERKDKDLGKQAQLLSDLYELLCESCGYQYFTAYDTFQSVGVEQTVFFRTVIFLWHEAKGKKETVEKAISLIVDNYLNRYTLYANLMVELIQTYESVDLKYYGIEVVRKLMRENDFQPEKKEEKKSWFMSSEDFRKSSKHNNLTALGLRLFLSLHEEKEGIEFYHRHYYQKGEEIKLFILVGILMEERKKEAILEEINSAIRKDIKPRESLMKLVQEIERTNELPGYL